MTCPWQKRGRGNLAHDFGSQDAYVLAGVLAHPKTTLATVPAALKAYEAVRLQYANDVHRRSRMNGQLIHFEPEAVQTVLQEWSSGAAENADRGANDDRSLDALDAQGDVVKLSRIGTAMFEGWKWSWTTDIEDDLHRALTILAEQPNAEGQD